ncbi:LysR substrate-binding domain-containing protein, partial [Burkholderia pseudomultivorans]|uniref:LysR family transcriptional regulator n=1 Tax=Burkholderia pseudomultivorans TaxID=1207504 RepID=UPI0028749DC7
MKVLDLDAVRAFVLVADLASFTRAADALGTTQSAVSLKLKRLEAHLGKPLLARTPRVVKLAADGENFLPAARALLDAHDRALGAIAAGTHRLSLGVSEHVAVPDLPAVLTSLHRQDPGLSLEMHLGTSTNLLAQYDERRLDAAIVRHEPGEDPPREDGTLLFTEPLAWLAAPDWTPRAGEPLPLAVLAGPCGVRAAALRALDHAGRPWREHFIGGGVAAGPAAPPSRPAAFPLARRPPSPPPVRIRPRVGAPPGPLPRCGFSS